MNKEHLYNLVKEAWERIEGKVVRTPICRLDWLKSKNHKQVSFFAKFENKQHTGSFKYRGALNKILTIEKDRTVVTASTGNHALAVAEISENLGIKAIICVPQNINPTKLSKLRQYKHDIAQVGNSMYEAVLYAKELAKTNGFVYISSYNDPLVVAGQGTVGMEILQDISDLDSVIIPTGGGSLICGVGSVLKTHNPNIKIIGVSPKEYPSFSKSFSAGFAQRVENPKRTFADGLAVNLEDEAITIDLARSLVDEIVEVAEESIKQSVFLLKSKTGEFIEHSAATPLAALLEGKIKISQNGPTNVLMVFTGGNINFELMKETPDLIGFTEHDYVYI